MMVETMLESSPDFGMSNGALPQWKRELLQRRAARGRPTPSAAPPPQPPPPPPPPDEEDEELRYGPGIVKRLKSRYLSLALRDAPRRRPSVLRRATSLEHLLDERPAPETRPPPVPAHDVPARPVSVIGTMLAPPPARRESVKRARSVDALSRLDAQPPTSPPPSPPPPPRTLAPRPVVPRAARPPRRPTPLLRETERPPPDLVRSALRKFEPAAARRPPRTSTPEPHGRAPSPAAADLSAVAVEDVEPGGARLVSRAALEGISRAGSSVRYSFPAVRGGSHLPPVAASNPVLLGRARLSSSPRRIGVIRPMPPAECAERSSTPPMDDSSSKAGELSRSPPSPLQPEAPRLERKDAPPAAVVEPILRTSSADVSVDHSPVTSPVLRSVPTELPPWIENAKPEPPARKPDLIMIDRTPPAEKPASPVFQVDLDLTPATTVEESERDPPRIIPSEPVVVEVTVEPVAVTVNGFKPPEAKGTPTRLGAAGIERPWSGAALKRATPETREPQENGSDNGKQQQVPSWARGGSSSSPAASRRRAPPPSSTSVVFNFSNRKEVPDYIENDGVLLRGSRRPKIKAGEPGVVVLRPEALARSESSDEEVDGDGCPPSPPSPCSVRFVNDNVLINGRSSLAARTHSHMHADRIAKLKLQFDDSLTRTHEYPSETSLCEEHDDHDAPHLAANTHIVSESLARYTPSKTLADVFQLGVTRLEPTAHPAHPTNGVSEAEETEGEREGEEGDSARCWSEARTLTTDLLF